MNVSLWCNGCQQWTTAYTQEGLHACGSEVDSAGVGKAPSDLHYEGEAVT